MAYLQNHARRMQPNLLRLRRKPALSTTCKCRGIIQKHHMLQRPVLLSLERQYRHDRSCPSWLPESCAVNLSFGLILSYLIFGLKLRILIVVSAGAGTFSLTPSLTCSRIVSESCSAAFKFIAIMTSADHSKRATQNNFAELSRIFQTRQSSPHDRLDNGQTLLHVSGMCLTPSFLALLNFLSTCATESPRACGRSVRMSWTNGGKYSNSFYAICPMLMHRRPTIKEGQYICHSEFEYH